MRHSPADVSWLDLNVNLLRSSHHVYKQTIANTGSTIGVERAVHGKCPVALLNLPTTKDWGGSGNHSNLVIRDLGLSVPPLLRRMN